MTAAINELKNKVKGFNWQDKLKFISNNFDNVVFSTSFSIEDQVITDFIFKNNLKIEIFTIDTGRLPSKTYDVWQATIDKYGRRISVFYPNEKALANFIKQSGINAFYESIDLRKQCCFVRKVEPLHRALSNKAFWISGLRRGHSSNRNNKEFFEFDAGLNITKFYPLLNESEGDIWSLINQNRIPFNYLYKQGYKSIGCDPCSRAVGEHEDIRAGRWWWENNSNKECGLHK